MELDKILFYMFIGSALLTLLIAIILGITILIKEANI